MEQMSGHFIFATQRLNDIEEHFRHGWVLLIPFSLHILSFCFQTAHRMMSHPNVLAR